MIRQVILERLVAVIISLHLFAHFRLLVVARSTPSTRPQKEAGRKCSIHSLKNLTLSKNSLIGWIGLNPNFQKICLSNIHQVRKNKP